MSHPEVLFAYRKVFHKGQWHLRCINCSSSSVEDWDWPAKWKMHTSRNSSITLSLPEPSFETTGIPLGPNVVYGTDEIVRTLDRSTAELAIVAQRVAILVADGDLEQFALPQFIAMTRPECECLVMSVRFDVKFLNLLPEVRAYERRMRRASLSEDDLMMCYDRTSQLTPIPAGLLLPGVVATHSAQRPVAYSVREWQPDDMAVVECFASGTITFDEPAVLKSNFDMALGAVTGSTFGQQP